jgi:hypothetical protein
MTSPETAGLPARACTRPPGRADDDWDGGVDDGGVDDGGADDGGADDGGADEDPSAVEPVDPPEPVRSAKATGIAPTADPTPSAIAKAPTRPTYRAHVCEPGSGFGTPGNRYSIRRTRRPAERSGPPANNDSTDMVPP